MSKFVVAGMVAIAIVGLAAIGSCFPSYKARGLLGGYDETMLGADLARIRRMSGNRYTSGAQARDFTLLRAAEIMLDNELPYFAVLDERNEKHVGTDAALEMAIARGTTNTSSNYETNTANAKYIPGESYIKYNPATGLLVRGFKEKPQEFFTFDAELTIKAIKSKYKIE